MKKQKKCGYKFFLFSITFILTFVFAAKGQHVDFSGTWKLDTMKSSFGNIPSKAAVQQYTMQQNEMDISLQWTIKNQNDEDVTSRQKLMIDGTPVKSLLPNKVTRMMTIKFSPDKKALLLTKTYSKPESPEMADYTLTEMWSIDNGVLIIELKSPGYVIKAVYDSVKED